MSVITKEQGIKIVKTSGYIAVSAVLGYLIALLADQPELFGVFTPIVNIVLVTIKQALSK